jgi:hypothetical protein
LFICYGGREKEDPMTEQRPQQAEVAGMASVIERLAGELALAEEPSCFTVALEGEDDAAPDA